MAGGTSPELVRRETEPSAASEELLGTFTGLVIIISSNLMTQDCEEEFSPPSVTNNAGRQELDDKIQQELKA